MIHSLKQLFQDHQHHIIYSVLTGSQAYGTATEESDEDIKGIFVLPQANYLSIVSPPNQVSDTKNDTVYYSLYRLMQLLIDANPNLLELLFTPKSCVLKQSDVMIPLLQHRSAFVTLKSVDSHIGYAIAQVRKARGQNKWVNNPQPKEIPPRAEFCWVIDHDHNAELPMRPKRLDVSGLDLTQCHCASLEHFPNVFRLYQYGQQARGVFRNGQLVCESIPKKDEKNHYCGLLMFNEPAWLQAKKDHKNYWEWYHHRNHSRWQLQECGEVDFDAKNMMHTIRLLYSAEHILTEGVPLVRFEGDKLTYLRDIRAGRYTYDELIQFSESLIDRCKELQNQSTLAKKANRVLGDQLLKEMTSLWESQQKSSNK